MLCFGFFNSLVFLRKFCIYPLFFVIEWFFMVSILLFKLTFIVSVVYFSIIVSKIWCNFCFVYSGRNLALVGKETISFIYTITIYCLRFPFRDYFFSLHIDKLIYYLPCSHNLFSHCLCWIFYDIYGCLENVFWIKRRKYLRIMLKIFFENGGLNQIIFLLEFFLGDLLLFSLSLFGGFYWSLKSYSDWFKIFW